jgi:uncharacterized protein YndB with AHSA1/START domain
MWKWIVGIVLVVIVGLAGTCWYAYQKLTAGGDSTTTTIGATPERIFASLADADSMPFWLGSRASVRASHPGPVTVGDTLRIDAADDSARGSNSRITWIVSDVQPAKLLVMQIRSDSNDQVIATQRDSLVAVGDSTMLITTVASPLMDSLRAAHSDSVRGKLAGAAIGMGSKIMLGAFRTMSERSHQRLKARLEGKPVGNKP